MNARALFKITFITMWSILAISFLVGNASHVDAAVKWEKKTVVRKKGIYTYEAHLSKDKARAWIYKVNSSKKNATNALVFPAKIKGAKLTRIMSDTSKYDDDDFYQNIFGSYVEPAHGCDGANSISKKIGKIKIPDTVEEIGSCSLSGLNHVKKIILPKALKKIGGWSFGGTESLISVSVPAKCSDSIVHAFVNCKKLSNILIDASNKLYCAENGMVFNKVKTELIWVAPAMVDVSIPDMVRKIKSYAFHMSQAKHVQLPATITQIGTYSFYGCKQISSIDVDPNNPVFKQDGNTIYKDRDKSLVLVVAKDKRVIISDKVTFISSKAKIVGKCKRVDIPVSVTKVGNNWNDFMEYANEESEDDDDDCYVEKIYMHMKTPPVVVNKKGKPYNKKDYSDLNIVSSNIYFVPKESIKQYKKWCPDGEYRTF